MSSTREAHREVNDGLPDPREDYFRFIQVRHPLERLASAYYSRVKTERTALVKTIRVGMVYHLVLTVLKIPMIWKPGPIVPYIYKIMQRPWTASQTKKMFGLKPVLLHFPLFLFETMTKTGGGGTLH